MPHSTPAHDSDEDELKLIQQAVNPDPRNDLTAFLNPDRELVLGEKADDAVDYEDVDFDDLPDEEVATGEDSDGLIEAETNDAADEGLDALHVLAREGQPPAANGNAEPGFDLDDLFGDAPSSPTAAADQPSGERPADGRPLDPLPDLNGDQRHASTATPEPPAAVNQKNVSNIVHTPPDVDDADHELYARQMALFNELRTLPPAPETMEEALAAMFPKYKKDQVPRFMELLPPKRLQYQGKTPLKVPKPVQPTKIALELSQDQERDFKTTVAMVPKKRKLGHSGLVQIDQESSESESSDEDIEMREGVEGEVIGGVTWTDLEAVCQDWNIETLEKSSDDGLVGLDDPREHGDDLFDDEDAEWDREFALPPPKVFLPLPVHPIMGSHLTESYQSASEARPSYHGPPLHTYVFNTLL